MCSIHVCSVRQIRVRFSPVGAAKGLEPIVVGGHYNSSTGDIICTTPPLEDTHPHYIPNEVCVGGSLIQPMHVSLPTLLLNNRADVL